MYDIFEEHSTTNYPSSSHLPTVILISRGVLHLLNLLSAGPLSANVTSIIISTVEELLSRRSKSSPLLLQPSTLVNRRPGPA
ncbi:hypothetical protein TYRP_020222 [Tyrophagus putrescentiae]|nr:hypothetical protein TYRP_020222 [Tyrophagus putrescentiae]